MTISELAQFVDSVPPETIVYSSIATVGLMFAWLISFGGRK